ncbi:MAG: nitrite reductase small subunit NirD [Variovorax sp.]|jgi:nitrite reductase (NADH) small subunit|nr:MAG: nitrite reductase small subunit NirD [Variovorax sp.]
MNDWTTICRLEDIPVLGARRVARPAGVAVAVFRTADDAVFALLDRCPHKGGPLSQGIVFGHSVACPLHNWTIALDDGCARAPDDGCVPRFACRVEAGAVLLDAGELARHALDLEAPRAGPGAATAGALDDESFSVQAPHGA